MSFIVVSLKSILENLAVIPFEDLHTLHDGLGHQIV